MVKKKLRSEHWFNNPDNPSMTALYLERYLNFGNFYSYKGQEFIDYIVDKVLISDDKILVINLED